MSKKTYFYNVGWDVESRETLSAIIEAARTGSPQRRQKVFDLIARTIADSSDAEIKDWWKKFDDILRKFIESGGRFDEK